MMESMIIIYNKPGWAVFDFFLSGEPDVCKSKPIKENTYAKSLLINSVGDAEGEQGQSRGYEDVVAGSLHNE